MKFFHYINFGLIFLFLVAICVIEDQVVDKSLNETQQYCYALEQVVERDGSLESMEVALLVDNFEYTWERDEERLCYMVNHKSIQDIGTEISKMKSYVGSNDVDAFKVSMESIKYFCESYMHFMGASLHNIL